MRDRWSLFRGLLGPLTRQAARRVIVGRQMSSDPASGRFTQSDVDHVVSRAWVTFADLFADLPRQATVASRLNVRLACLTLAFFRALLEYDIGHAYAIELTAGVIWSFYWKRGVLGRIVETRDADFDSLSVGDIVPVSSPLNPPGYMGRLFPTPEARLEREDRHAFWTSVRTPR